MMKKKILFISEALWIGGIETALVNLLNRIDYTKYDVTCLIIRGSLEIADRITSKCRLIVADREKIYTFSEAYKYNRLYHLTEISANPSRLHKIMMCAVPIIKYIENLLYIRYIRKQMKHEHFNTCVIYSDRTAEIAVKAINAEQYFLFYHNAIMDKAYHDEIGYRKSKKIIAVSEKKKEELKAFRPKYADKYVTIHNLVDLNDVIKQSKENQDVAYREDAFNLVTCGRLAHQKAIDWAVIAMKILWNRGYHNIYWWIIGGGPDEEELKKKILEVGIENNFYLLGMKKNPYPYIANADLYVQPSRYENYSVVILEAMGLCKPILATIPAAEMQIRSGENGLLCEANPESIARSIEHLYLHREEMERYVRTLKENSLEKQNDEIMDSLYRLFDGK